MDACPQAEADLILYKCPEQHTLSPTVQPSVLTLFETTGHNSRPVQVKVTKSVYMTLSNPYHEPSDVFVIVQYGESEANQLQPVSYYIFYATIMQHFLSQTLSEQDQMYWENPPANRQKVLKVNLQDLYEAHCQNVIHSTDVNNMGSTILR
jgi:hypothetical protein